MSNQVIRKRRGTTSDMSTLVALPGEVFIDITKPTLVVHDGSTAGGWPLAHEIHVHSNASEMTAGFMSPDDKTKLDQLSASGGIQNVQSNTVTLTPPRNTINFNTDFTVVDNPGSTRTDFSVSQGLKDSINNNIIAMIVALG